MNGTLASIQYNDKSVNYTLMVLVFAVVQLHIHACTAYLSVTHQKSYGKSKHMMDCSLYAIRCKVNAKGYSV